MSTINILPDPLLCDIFEKSGNMSIPCVCRQWNSIWKTELSIFIKSQRLSEDETLKVRHFSKEPLLPLREILKALFQRAYSLSTETHFQETFDASEFSFLEKMRRIQIELEEIERKSSKKALRRIFNHYQPQFIKRVK